jgi:hypothetical protein
MRRLLPVVVLVLLLAGCGGSPAEQAALDASGLAASADATAKAGGARFDLSVRQEVPGAAQPVAITASGVIDAAGRRALMAMDFSSLADQFGSADLGDGRVEAIVDGLVVYVKASFLPEGLLPRGKEWLRLDAAALAKRAGVSASDLAAIGQTDPLELLDYLRGASGSVDRVGEEQLDGVTTTHYRAKVDLRRSLAKLPKSLRQAAKPGIDQLVQLAGPTLPVDVWVGDDGLVRRIASTLTMRPPGAGQDLTTSYRLDLSDYGIEPDIQPPAKAKTVDLLSLLPGAPSSNS